MSSNEQPHATQQPRSRTAETKRVEWNKFRLHWLYLWQIYAVKPCWRFFIVHAVTAKEPVILLICFGRNTFQGWILTGEPCSRELKAHFSTVKISFLSDIAEIATVVIDIFTLIQTIMNLFKQDRWFIMWLGVLNRLAIANAQCYYPGGMWADDQFPCDKYAYTSLCCPTGWTCFSNKLCIATDPSVVSSDLQLGTAIRGTCTNPLWNNNACGDFCLGEST